MKSSAPDSLKNIDIWNLRGSAVPMDKLAPKLIRRAQKKNYLAVIIDPIYKVITGDENSADQMARFCNQFDLICARLGCAVIYCHHHSKGAQGQKASMDRASGSGVFARDPDALLDMIELPVSDALNKAEGDRAGIEICRMALKKSIMAIDPDKALSQDDLCSYVCTLAACERLLNPYEYGLLLNQLEENRARLKKRTAWRIEGTLREFERFEPVNLWFDYPVHTADTAGVLGDAKPEAEMKPWEKGARRNRQNAPSRRQQARERLDMAVASANMGEPPTVRQVADYMDLDESTVRKYLKNSDKFALDKNNGTVIEKKDGQEKT